MTKIIDWQMEEKTLNQLWREVTGLVMDVETLIEENKVSSEWILWHIPDGAMLADTNSAKAKLVKELFEELEAAGADVDIAKKMSEADVEYNDEDNGDSGNSL